MMDISTAPVYIICLFILTIKIHTSNGNFNVTDDTYFEIKWPGIIQSQRPSTETTESKISLETNEEESSDSVLVHTDPSSSYRCFLPNKVHNQKYRKTDTDYKGPGPLMLLQPLFEQKACSYKIESYWTYELCHGKHIRQYHEEMEGDKTRKKMEFFLGFYHDSNNKDMPSPIVSPPTEESSPESEKMKPKGPPTINIEGTDFPYFRVNFSAGSVCDLTKQPRQVELFYICLESGRGEIYEVVETESCRYRAVVMSKLLCQHPSFTVARPHVNSIKCRPADSTTPDKPRALVLQELMQKRATEAAHTSTLEGLFGRDVNIEATRDKDRVYIKIGSKKKEGEADPSSQPDAPEESPESTSRSTEGASQPVSPRQHRIPTSHPPVMQLQRFVSGKDCVFGGTGWWRHELCFGKQVIQYHDDAQTGQRTTIVLGRWDEEKHQKWIQKTPHARPVRNKQYSLLYSDGDYCDKTQRPRRVEVRVRCLTQSSSSSAMTIMLQEKETFCDYILTVESSMLCPLINQVDENGLLIGDLKLV